MKSLNPILILRLGAGICFIGHGILSLIGKEKFVELLGTFNINESQGLAVLIAVGCLDILVGLSILFKPSKIVLQWALVWTTLTVLAWGIHGDSIMDLMRRAPYIAVPSALLVLLYGKSSVLKMSKTDSVTKSTKSIKQTASSSIVLATKVQEEAIDALDLSSICMKLMNDETEGWTQRQCAEVAIEYRRYLKLNLLYPDANIVPNMAIDTMWHYHILDTQAYYADCNEIFGHILHHYPYYGMQGESDNSNRVNSFDVTKELYEKTFNVPMSGPEYLPSFQMAS